jgi:hypothetical protein
MRQQATSGRDRFLLQGPGVRAEAREATERARRAGASSARALEAPVSAVAVIVAGLVGAALLWSALELPHEISRIRVNEGIIGALVLIACGVIAATARPRG